MRSEVCVVGSFMMDLVVRAPRRPEIGETLSATSFEMFLGGKGFNQAVAAARAGARRRWSAASATTTSASASSTRSRATGSTPTS